jgi:hypothetical protein
VGRALQMNWSFCCFPMLKLDVRIYICCWVGWEIKNAVKFGVGCYNLNMRFFKIILRCHYEKWEEMRK